MQYAPLSSGVTLAMCRLIPFFSLISLMRESLRMRRSPAEMIRSVCFQTITDEPDREKQGRGGLLFPEMPLLFPRKATDGPVCSFPAQYTRGSRRISSRRWCTYTRRPTILAHGESTNTSSNWNVRSFLAFEMCEFCLLEAPGKKFAPYSLSDSVALNFSSYSSSSRFVTTLPSNYTTLCGRGFLQFSLKDGRRRGDFPYPGRESSAGMPLLEAFIHFIRTAPFAF